MYVIQSEAKDLLMLVQCRLREILRCALDDSTAVRATAMPGHVAQSAAKGLLIVVQCRLREILRFALDDNTYCMTEKTGIT